MRKIRTFYVVLFISMLLSGCVNESTPFLNDRDKNVMNVSNASENEILEPLEDKHNPNAANLSNKSNDPVVKLEVEHEIQTELDFYLPETKRILVYWKNSSDYSVMFGQSWYLEKHNGVDWERIGHEVPFNSVGYLLNPDTIRKHVYQVRDYVDLLEEGLYRIVAPYFYDKDVPITSDEEYFITAEFTVTNDKSKIKKSELDYDNLEGSKDLTPQELEQKTSIRIYKDRRSFDTTIVIDGEEYEIGVGEGHWGVVDISFYEADNRKYLIYTYSRSTDTIISRVAVLDLLSLENIFISRAFSGFDLCIGGKPLEGTVFTVSSLEHWESSDDDGISDAIIDTIGHLIYENGKFELKDIN